MIQDIDVIWVMNISEFAHNRIKPREDEQVPLVLVPCHLRAQARVLMEMPFHRSQRPLLDSVGFWTLSSNTVSPSSDILGTIEECALSVEKMQSSVALNVIKQCIYILQKTLTQRRRASCCGMMLASSDLQGMIAKLLERDNTIGHSQHNNSEALTHQK